MTQLSTHSLRIAPILRAQGALALPGSKSASIRALLLAAHARGTTTLSNLLDSDDVHVMRAALTQLGVAMESTAHGLAVTGARSFAVRTAELDMGNSGLSMRTLVPALAFCGGKYRLTGVPRMQERPIGDLVDALRQVGAQIGYTGQDGFPPLAVAPARIKEPCRLTVRSGASSQFLSGLLQAAPLWGQESDTVIRVGETLISRSYVAMTIALMRAFGVEVAGDVAAVCPEFRIAAGAAYRSPEAFLIEGDASSASYFLALGALVGGPVRVTGVSRASVQPDIALLNVLERMGASVRSGSDWVEVASAGVAGGFRLAPIEADLNHMPDAAMTVAMLCLFASGPSRLANIGSWRVKETDRLAAMACELRKLGAGVEEGADWIAITPPERWRPAVIETYDDHRMAMSFSLAAASGLPVEILDPACVSKTFPDYFARLAALTGAP